MKYSPTPTNYIVVNAYTNSDWDNCSFAILEVSPAFIATLLLRRESIALLKSDSSFLEIAYLDRPVGFFSHLPEEFDNQVLENNDWVFVDLKEQELDQMPKPESLIDCYHISINCFDAFGYNALGIYSGERFWTADIDLMKLMGYINKHTK